MKSGALTHLLFLNINKLHEANAFHFLNVLEMLK